MPEAETDYMIEGPESLGQTVRSESLVRFEKRNRIIRLRRMGLTYEQISEALAKDEEDPVEIAANSCRDAVHRYLEQMATENRESVDQLRELENVRLDHLQKSLETKVQQGNVPAIKTVLGIMERRAKLNGLDKPEIKGIFGAFAHIEDVADPSAVDDALTAFTAAYTKRGIEAPVIEGSAEPVANGDSEAG